jgi:hypothetical protein
MTAWWREGLIGQFHAALSTLGQAVDGCPQSEWNESQGDYPFSQVVFHTLFFTDYYLERNPESFRLQGFHRNHPEFFRDYEELEWQEPKNIYDRSGCGEYLLFCIDKSAAVISADTVKTLGGPSGFENRPSTRGELYIYTVRHIQHHAAQLGLRVQLLTGRELQWVSSGIMKP